MVSLNTSITPASRPTLQDLVRAYERDGIPPERSVRYIVEGRMAAGNARGKGYKAGRRAMQLGLQTAASLEALARRMAAERKRHLQAARCELRQARSFTHHYRTNFHE